MKMPKENEKMIKRDKELALQNLTKIHAKLAFENETILDFDEYILALAMLPISFSEQAKMRGIIMEEIYHIVNMYLNAFPVKEE
jgi:hypothetical protein